MRTLRSAGCRGPFQPPVDRADKFQARKAVAPVREKPEQMHHREHASRVFLDIFSGPTGKEGSKNAAGAVNQRVVGVATGERSGEVTCSCTGEGKVFVHYVVLAAVTQKPSLEIGPAASVFAQPFYEVDLAPSVNVGGHLPPDVGRVLDYIAGRDSGIESELLMARDYLEVGQVVFIAGEPKQNDAHLERLAVGRVMNQPASVRGNFIAPYFSLRDNAFDQGISVGDYAFAQEDVVEGGPGFVSIG